METALFLSQLIPNGECLEFRRRLNEHGYGRVPLGRRGATMYGHRFAWQQLVGPIPEGMKVLHRCDNPPCVRIVHLFLGTQADNLADMHAKKRWSRRGQFGDENPARQHPERLARGDRSGMRLHPELVKRGENSPLAKWTDAQITEVRHRVHDGESQADVSLEFGISKSHMSRIVRGVQR